MSRLPVRSLRSDWGALWWFGGFAACVVSWHVFLSVVFRRDMMNWRDRGHSFCQDPYSCQRSYKKKLEKSANCCFLRHSVWRIWESLSMGVVLCSNSIWKQWTWKFTFWLWAGVTVFLTGHGFNFLVCGSLESLRFSTTRSLTAAIVSREVSCKHSLIVCK